MRSARSDWASSLAERVVVTGTDTEVGKTWVTARLAEALHQAGLRVHARKPVQSYEEEAGPTDAEVLAQATGEDPALVCPGHRWYPLPLAPPMAAEALERDPLALEDLVTELNLPDDGITFVEGVGGPRSPLTDDADTTDLARSIGAGRVLLVADSELGTINRVLLSSEAFAPLPVHVFLNRYDDGSELHSRNRRWLAEECGLDVTTTIEELTTRFTEVR